MFEELGFEIYESTTKTYAIKEIHEVIGGPPKQVLETREVCKIYILFIVLIANKKL